VDVELVDLLEDIRNHFNKPVLVISGLRCPTHNKDIGGAEHSMHMKSAADIIVEDTPPKDVYDYCCKTYPHKYGFGNYPGFTHVDPRPNKARW